MTGLLLLGVATLVMLVGAVLDPSLRYVYLFFSLLGLLGVGRAYRAWRSRSEPMPGHRPTPEGVQLSDSGWVAVAEYAAGYEAELAAGRLESVGIPSRINQQGGVGIFGPGHTGSSVRGISLAVPEARLEEARDALDL